MTTHAADGTEPQLNLADRDFTASCPNDLWVSELTYVRMAGRFAYVALVIDVFARYVVA